MAGRWHLDASGEWLAGAQQVEELLDLPLLQRLAQQRAQEIQIVETDDTFEFIQVRRHSLHLPPFINRSVNNALV